jgi:hypothetical protein
MGHDVEVVEGNASEKFCGGFIVTREVELHVHRWGVVRECVGGGREREASKRNK